MYVCPNDKDHLIELQDGAVRCPSCNVDAIKATNLEEG